MFILWIVLITLGLGQLAATVWRWRALSFVGPNQWLGYGFSVITLLAGSWGLISLNLGDHWPSPLWAIILWVIPAGLLTIGLQVLAGSYISPPPHPNLLFSAHHPAHGGCQALQIPIPNSPHATPALFLQPPSSTKSGPVLCLVHGAGDTKISFKWRLITTLLEKNISVLTIDLPGHGEAKQNPLDYPHCLSVIPAAIAFLNEQAQVTQIGLYGVSLGGAIALKSLLKAEPTLASTIHAIAIQATPTYLAFNRRTFYREYWRTLRSPLLSILNEVSVKQLRQIWTLGRYRSHYNVSQLVSMFDAKNNLKKFVQAFPDCPILLIYSRYDSVAPPSCALAMQQAAPEATLLQTRRSSHVALMLMQPVIDQAADWFSQKLYIR